MLSARVRSFSAPIWSPRLKASSLSGSSERAPQPERIHALGAPADDRRVVRDGEDDLARLPGVPHGAGFARRRLDAAAEPDFIGAFLALELPGVAVQQPILRQLDLPSLH